jgi:hypothetical protein
MSAGRPTKYTEEIAARICEAVATSTNGLEKICDSNPDFPHKSTVRRWIVEVETFRDLYARAKEQQADVLADEIIDIADQVAEDKLLTHEKVGAAKLRVDSRKWVASKLKPKVYGDKTDLTTGGESMNKGFYDFLQAVSQKHEDE